MKRFERFFKDCMSFKMLRFDVTNTDDMIDFAKTHPEIMRDAANISTQATLAAFVSNFGAGKVAEKLRDAFGLGELSEMAIDGALGQSSEAYIKKRYD